MIKLKRKISKYQLIKELEIKAKKRYDAYWQRKEIEAYMDGVSATLERLKDRKTIVGV